MCNSPKTSTQIIPTLPVKPFLSRFICPTSTHACCHISPQPLDLLDLGCIVRVGVSSSRSFPLNFSPAFPVMASLNHWDHLYFRPLSDVIHVTYPRPSTSFFLLFFLKIYLVQVSNFCFSLYGRKMWVFFWQYYHKVLFWHWAAQEC